MVFKRERKRDIRPFIEKLSDQNPETRRTAATRLTWTDDQRAVEPLIKALEDESPRVRASAALALGHFNSPKALPALLDHLTHDENGHVRAMCVNALWTAELPLNETAIEAIFTAAGDSDHHVRIVVAAVMRDINTTRAVSLLMKMLHDPEWHVRESVCNSLVELKVADERIVAAIDKLRHEPEGLDADKQMLAIGEFMQALFSYPEIAEMVTEFDGKSVDEDSRKMVKEIAENAHEQLKDEPLPDPYEWTLAKLAERAKKLLEDKAGG